MYTIGEKEVQAVRKVLMRKKLFRYGVGTECERFEKRYAKFVGAKHVVQTASGTMALTAALVGLGVGPGDEVIVPACTYMATAISVLAAGAIPIIVDIDDTITIDPKAVEAAIGPRTKAVIPVHMWGLPCDMNAIMKIAKKRKLLVAEDACQSVGGAYKGKMLGAIGHAGAFSFNYYKNISAGEGGAFATNSKKAYERGSIMIDCFRFYWDGRDPDLEPFAANGARASEIAGAVLNVQFGRLPGLIKTMRAQKKRILEETADTALAPIRANSLDWECGTHVMYTLPTAAQADAFAKKINGTVASKTGRHVYTEWDPVLGHKGAHHPALDPFKLKENKDCRKKYTKKMCAKSLDILSRTVFFGTAPTLRASAVAALIKKIRKAAREVL
ncbi:MAG: aminotransferase class V-fold PLP-dependent enzyme [Planctomycetes bacterium]|nr:aminotransferase class V-fold PLP-dependent enzyme [Planctomycetota bacterium]